MGSNKIWGFALGRFQGRKSVQWCVVLQFCLLIGAPLSSYGLGKFGFDTSGFLKNSSQQDNASVTLVVGLDLETKDGEIAEAELDLSTYTFVNDGRSFTIEAAEAYVATSDKLMHNHKVSLGRKLIDWSTLDEEWRLGVWSPRFMWDPIQSERVGLTGLFYEYESKWWKVATYGSFLSVPERGYPFYEDNGQLLSTSRFWNPLPTTLNLQLSNSVDVPINYTLQDIDFADVLLRGNAAVSVRFGQGSGYWAQANYGYLPVYQPDVAVDAYLDITNFNVNADLYTRFRMKHLVTFESGYQERNWSVWGSLSREIPSEVSAPDNFIREEVGPATIAGLGASVGSRRGFSVSGSIINIFEQKRPEIIDAPSDIEIPLPGRFKFNRAVQLASRLDGVTPFVLGAGWTYDYQNENAMISFDASYPSPLRADASKGWSINLGADVFLNDNDEGYLGDFEGNDRVRGKVTYAF